NEDVTGRTRNDEARAQLGADDLLAKTCVAASLSGRLALSSSSESHGLLTSLSGLAANDLAGVAHTLALVRLGLAKLPNVGGHLAHLLLVDALHGHLGVAFNGKGDAGGRVDRDGVRE